MGRTSRRQALLRCCAGVRRGMHETRLGGMDQRCAHGMKRILVAYLGNVPFPRITFPLAEGEDVYQLHQMRRLLGERLRRCRELFSLRGVGLRYLVRSE